MKLLKNANSKANQKGFTLIEIVIGITVVGVMAAITVPAGMNAFRKAEANNLKQEFDMLSSSVISLKGMNQSHIPTIMFNGGNIKELQIPIPQSYAFDTMKSTEGIKPSGTSGAKNIKVTFGIDTATVAPSTEFATGATIKYLAMKDTAYTTTLTDLPMPQLSANGVDGIAPIFNISDTTLLEDFVNSSKGLNLKEFRTQMSANPSNELILAVIFGGKQDGSGTGNMDQFSIDPKNHSIIELTKADNNAIMSLEANSSVKISTDLSKGQLYFVTDFPSQKKFIDYMSTTNSNLGGVPKTLLGISDADLPKMYEILAEGFKIDTPVYVPHRFTDATKSVESDLKNGFYRP